MNQQAIYNRVWSHVLLEELVRHGVRHVCVAPGSRSTPLTLEADANSNLMLHHHFDERGLGFLALGLAKAGSEPVAVIVTSGTAVANLLPAVAEASLTGEKLILLTADRPPELVGCGANQAIVQPGIFSSHVTAALNLPSPREPLSLSWLLTSVDDLMYQQRQRGGAVHLNCPFPEPLYTSDPIDYPGYFPACVQQWAQHERPYVQHHIIGPSGVDDVTLAELELCSSKQGVLILGQLELEESKQGLELAKRLGWPVFCDPQSGVSSEWAHFDLWLQDIRYADQLQSCDCIVQFGSRLVSKRLNAWLQAQAGQGGAEYIYCSPHTGRNNPGHLPQKHLMTTVTQVTSAWVGLLDSDDQNRSYGWAKHLRESLIAIRKWIDTSVVSSPLNELSVAQALSRVDGRADLFIGNSLIVRLVDMFGRLNEREVFSNRGASGIDGLVATAVGVQRIRNKPLLMLLGDTSLLYDLNALALLSRQELPFVVIVTNNDGGAIFDLLPVPEAQKVRLYQMPHGFEFRHAARQFGLSYSEPESQSALIESVNQHITEGCGGLLVEIKTPGDQASAMIKQVVQGIYAI